MTCKCGHKKTDHEFRDYEHGGKCTHKTLIKKTKTTNYWESCKCVRFDQ